MRKKTNSARPDLFVLAIVLGILAFGLMMIYDASIVSATRDFGDKYYFVKEQGKWIAVGIGALLLGMRIPYRFYRRFALLGLIGAIILLGLVFVPVLGIEAYGARRWLDFGAFSFQPVETAKLAMIVFLAAWFERGERLKSFRDGLLPILLILTVIGALVLLQPDLGSFLIIGVAAILTYLAVGGRALFVLIATPVATALGVLAVITSEYRRARLLTFLDPTADPQGQGYHINQILLALGSGGLFGSGIGQSRGKYEYLPEVTTDSIFAVIGEELGFIGATLLILVFGLLIYRLFRIAERAPDQFGKILAVGVSSTLAVQIFLNLAAMVSLVPLTGVPLPLISYGGTSLVVTLFCIGMLLNISKKSNTQAS